MNIVGEQSVSELDEFVKSRLRKTKGASFSTTFRYSLSRVPLIGDYPILTHIARLYGEMGVKLTDSQIYQALKYSRDYQNTRAGRTHFKKDIEKQNRVGLKNS